MALYNLYNTWRPGAAGSTPVSNMAITVFRPSHSGKRARNLSAPVSFLGMRECSGKGFKSSSLSSAMLFNNSVGGSLALGLWAWPATVGGLPATINFHSNIHSTAHAHCIFAEKDPKQEEAVSLLDTSVYQSRTPNPSHKAQSYDLILNP